MYKNIIFVHLRITWVGIRFVTIIIVIYIYYIYVTNLTTIHVIRR